MDAPARWDEYLDLDIPILIAHTCSSWSELGEALWEAGFSCDRVARLVESDGAVKAVRLEKRSLKPDPETNEWVLALNWTSSEEGWRTRLPLWGRSYIVTRQSDQGQQMVDRLKELGAQVQAVPAIDFKEPDDPAIIIDAIDRLTDFDWLIFTSPNGVRFFFDYLRKSVRDHRALGQARFACIGPGTAKALSSEGFLCDILPKEYVAEGLLEALESQDMAGKPVLIPRAQEAREVLPETLKARGARVVVAPVYQTVPPPLPDDAESFIKETRVLFTSSSTVSNWIKVTENRDLPCYCIGPITAATAKEENLKILGVASVHTIQGLVEEVLRKDSERPAADAER